MACCYQIRGELARQGQESLVTEIESLEGNRWRIRKYRMRVWRKRVWRARDWRTKRIGLWTLP